MSLAGQRARRAPSAQAIQQASQPTAVDPRAQALVPIIQQAHALSIDPTRDAETRARNYGLASGITLTLAALGHKVEGLPT